MPIEIMDAREIALRERHQTDLLLRKRMHSWVDYKAPGAKDKMHCHNEDQTFYCIEGECTMHFPDGGKGVLKSGMLATITGGSFYQLENSGDGPLVLLGNRSGDRETTTKVFYETREVRGGRPGRRVSTPTLARPTSLHHVEERVPAK